MKRLLAMAVMALLTFPVSAQIDAENLNIIYVTGRVEKKISPDRIYVQIVIKDNDIKGLSVDKIQSRMIQTIKDLGIDADKNLKINDMDNALRRRKEVQTTKSYQLVVGDASQLAAVYGALADLGISDMSISKVENSKIDEYRRDIREEAIKQAKTNAEILARAIGQSIGPAVYIYDNGGNLSDVKVVAFSRAVANKTMSEELSADADGQSQIEFREITLSHSVSVKFRLNDK